MPSPRANTSRPLPSAAQAREHAPPSHTPQHAKLSHRHAHPSPGWTRLAPTRSALSQARTPLPRPHPPRPHAGSCSAAACCCHAPATTPTPHSPGSAGIGVDASSILLAVAPVPFVPAPTPQHKPPKDPRPSTRTPRQSPPRLNTLACPHTTPASPQHHLPSPLCCAGARARPAITHAPTRRALSQASTPLPRPHPPRPHAGSCSAAACCCQAPATTPTPHSPASVGIGVDASSVEPAIEQLAFVGTTVAEPDERHYHFLHRVTTRASAVLHSPHTHAVRNMSTASVPTQCPAPHMPAASHALRAHRRQLLRRSTTHHTPHTPWSLA
jgi:hypothetical protein